VSVHILTEFQQQSICHLYLREFMSQTDIAVKFDVARNTIHRVLKNRGKLMSVKKHNELKRKNNNYNETKPAKNKQPYSLINQC